MLTLSKQLSSVKPLRTLCSRARRHDFESVAHILARLQLNRSCLEMRIGAHFDQALSRAIDGTLAHEDRVAIGALE